MSDLWLPIAVVVAAFALSYLFCVRPMRRGQCMTTRPGAASQTGELDRALTEARAELAQLRKPPIHHHLVDGFTRRDRELRNPHGPVSGNPLPTPPVTRRKARSR